MTTATSKLMSVGNDYPKTVFLLGNGRSGTRFLCDLFRNNVANCVAVHEPYVGAHAPSMFGKPIYDYTHGDHEAVRRAFERKLRGIRGCRAAWYVEANHAFLKSFADVAVEALPDMKLVHVVRNPLRVAASQVNREEFIHRLRIPLRYYRAGDRRRYFRWSLTGEEPIYQFFDRDALTLFQNFAIQWIEIENRAQRFLDRYQKRPDCFLLHTPGDLNDPRTIAAMFDFFGMPLRNEGVVVRGKQHRTPGRRPAEGQSLVAELRTVVERLPDEYLEIFGREPYSRFEWVGLLRK